MLPGGPITVARVTVAPAALCRNEGDSPVVRPLVYLMFGSLAMILQESLAGRA